MQVAVADMVCASLVQQGLAAALQTAEGQQDADSKAWTQTLQECQSSIVPVHKLKRIFHEHIYPKHIEPALKSKPTAGVDK